MAGRDEERCEMKFFDYSLAEPQRSFLIADSQNRSYSPNSGMVTTLKVGKGRNSRTP